MREEIRYIINTAIERLDLYSEDAASLIFKTGMAESGYRALKQKGGPALGFFQIEPETARDIWENYVMYRPFYRDALLGMGFDDSRMEYCVLSNIGLQSAFCRLHYRRIPKYLPKANDLMAQAKYWKTFYNTIKGKGTVEHFMEANE
jgi:hypothetical protein